MLLAGLALGTVAGRRWEDARHLTLCCVRHGAAALLRVGASIVPTVDCRVGVDVAGVARLLLLLLLVCCCLLLILCKAASAGWSPFHF
jgi:hypothetical protein